MWFFMAAEAGGQGFDFWQVVKNANPLSKVVLAILVLCSILSVAVIIERWIVLKRARAATEDDMIELDRQIQSGAVVTDFTSASHDASPLSVVLHAGVQQWRALCAAGECRPDYMETKVNEALVRELQLVRSKLRTNLPILMNIASNSPFIGLFGTVIGIILTFNAIAQHGNMGMSMVGSGIADALIATAMGLFAAIPAVIAYNVFVTRINLFILELDKQAAERIYFLIQNEQNGVKPRARSGVA